MKVEITGASHFVNRMFQACGKYQWARELLMNSLEAGATRVEFGIEWQGVISNNQYCRTVADNGCGMSKKELVEFFKTLGKGKKKIGSVHDNFGIGGKIATLPWNEDGVVVLSYQNRQGSMIWIEKDTDSEDYELVEFEVEGKKTVVVDPDALEWDDDITDWSKVAPDWIRDQGTIVVLLGKDGSDTVLGNIEEGENTTKGLSVYLNSRFWDLSDQEIRVVELRSTDKSNWPTDSDDTKSLNNRRVQGARYYLTDVTSTKDDGGKLKDSGVMRLDDERVKVNWYLWEGDRPTIHGYAQEKGYIALRYKGELYSLDSGKVRFRRFGIIESDVQRRTTIILEPDLFDKDATEQWGIYPDQSRNSLRFTDEHDKGIEPPLTEWGRMFSENMPKPIYEAIRNARNAGSGDVDDDEYRKRLADKFGERWTTQKTIIKDRKGDPATPKDGESVQDKDRSRNGESKEKSKRRRRRSRRKSKKKKSKEGAQGGERKGRKEDVPGDIPRYQFRGSEVFEKDWHLAMFAPEDPQGPTVFINTDAPVLLEVVSYHQDFYLETYAKDVRDKIFHVFGEVAACKVAHSQKLTSEVTEEELNERYRSEEALTLALMGLIAEESLISRRLRHLGPKQAA